MILTIVLLIIVSLFYPISVWAGEPPQLTSPSDGSTVSSSSLNWQAPSYQLYSSNPYRVQVDDDSSFSSLNKDYYTTNTHYTPSLDPGTWYWKVKAKDSAGTWSDWSTIWSFILSTSTPEPSSSTSTPTPTSSSSASSSFLISNVPSQINSDQSFSASINLSLPDNPSIFFYLKGAFKKADSSNYFGLTKVGSTWIKNGSSYSDQYKITTDSSGNWSGNLEIQPDSSDSGYTGTGDYIFKVGRYSSSGSGPTWSNEVTIKITGSATSSNSSASTSNPSPKSSATSQSSSKSTGSVLSAKATPKSSTSSASYRIASVAAVSTLSANPSDETEVAGNKAINFIPWIGGFFILVGILSLILIYLRNKNAA